MIVSLDGYPTNDMRDIQRVMYDKKPGELIYLLVIRQGEFILVTYALETLDFPADFYDEDKPEELPTPDPTPDK